MSHNDLLILLAGSFLPNNLVIWMFKTVFPRRRILRTLETSEQRGFAKLAVWCGDKFGSPTNFMMWMAIIGIWIWSGHLFHYNNTWQLLINTPTTVIELFAAILIQYVGNRIERRQSDSEQHMIHILERIEVMENNLQVKVDAMTGK